MAQDAYLTDNPESADIARQRKLAEMLTLQAFQQPQGGLVSGHYVAPSWTQQLAPLVSGLAGQQMNKQLDEKQLALADALRQKQTAQIEKYGELEKQDKSAALRFALSTDNPVLRDIAKEELKGITLSEGAVHRKTSLSGGVTELKGNEKYHAPTSVDMGTLGTMLIYPDGRREMVQKGREGPAGQVLETENGPMLVNTRTGQAQPIMAGGQPLAGGKPLTESQSNATAFGMRAKEANAIATSLENKGVTNTGLTRATIGGAVGGTPFIGENLENTANTLLNWTASPEQQKTKQARQNFITAVLRKESGATIRPDEFRVEEEKYFPKINDSQEVIAQKQRARELAIKALETQAGPGKRQIEQLSIPSETGGWSVKAIK